MSQTLFPSKGCVYLVDRSEGNTAGYYSIEGLETGGKGPSVILIDDIKSEASDIINPVVTLGGGKMLYRFGSDFGAMSIVGAVLLGPSASGTTGVEAYSNLIEFFEANRVSAKKEPTALSLPGGVARKVHLYSMTIGDTDPVFHVAQFMIGAITADLPEPGL